MKHILLLYIMFFLVYRSILFYLNVSELYENPISFKKSNINTGSICLYKRQYDNESSILRNTYLYGIPFLSNSIYYHIGIILVNPKIKDINNDYIKDGIYVLHYVYSDYDITVKCKKNGVCLTPIEKIHEDIYIRKVINTCDNIDFDINLENLYNEPNSNMFPSIYDITKKVLEIEDYNHICTSFVHYVFTLFGIKTNFSPFFPSDFSYYFGDLEFNGIEYEHEKIYNKI